MDIQKIDRGLIGFFHKHWIQMARFGLFVVYFWFGILKVIGLSPASPLVQALFERTIHFMPFTTFIVLFGLFEMLIGILFLVKGAERIVFPLLALHMVTTILPLALVPEATWQSPFVPTLEGQYIIKNLLLIACAMGIAGSIPPLKRN
jgi:uncharacterized membrane protein YkgB